MTEQKPAWAMTRVEFARAHPATRHFQRYTSEERADRAASHRLGYQQRKRVGEFFWTHPFTPNIAHATRKAALKSAREVVVEQALQEGERVPLEVLAEVTA